MKHLAVLAALFLPLAAQAQDQSERFRYLGISADFAVLGGEATGPREARTINGVAVNRKESSGPGGIDGVHITIAVDCVGRTTQMTWVAGYQGLDKVVESPDPGMKEGPTAGPHLLLFDYACSGTAPAGAPAWVDGVPAALTYARDKVRN